MKYKVKNVGSKILINLDTEQKEIVGLIEKLSKTSKITRKGKRFSWNKFNGNMVSNVVKEYIRRHLKENLMVVGPAFIKGHPNEFDLLIVDKSSQPGRYTDAYDTKFVHKVIELKSHGTYSEKALKRIKDTFDELTKRYPMKCVYLAIRESGMPKRKGSKNWVKITKKLLNPYKVFVLCDSRTKEYYPNQWGKFIEFINST